MIRVIRILISSYGEDRRLKLLLGFSARKYKRLIRRLCVRGDKSSCIVLKKAQIRPEIEPVSIYWSSRSIFAKGGRKQVFLPDGPVKKRFEMESIQENWKLVYTIAALPLPPRLSLGVNTKCGSVKSKIIFCPKLVNWIWNSLNFL